MSVEELLDAQFEQIGDPALQGIRARRERLVDAPTPLQRLDRLRKSLGGGPELWIKRDDLTGLALGGNKARKLEYLLAQARAEDADTLVTVGAAQSNHARQTAAAAAAAGLEAVLVLRVAQGASENYRTSGNILLDRIFGARIVFAEETPQDPHPERALAEEIIAVLKAQGRRPFFIPSGGSTEIGALGYIEAYAEIASAGVEFEEIVLASGSGGTQAGLIAGRQLLAGAGLPAIHGVGVGPGVAEFRDEVETLSRRTLALFGRELDESPIVDDAHTGSAYGVPTEAGLEAIRLFAQTEGILLDPVYTAKAAAALIFGIRAGRYREDARVLFLHTGGAPALFAYAGELPAGW
ncbi:D-cysteine desulfhydrase family protein [Corynebacterium pacaense]|uniref:D-cysteine desulfhydrase family protein n=1 Tax=Corynebacterium pacaense TaxID=1816684 RepID=UPI0009BAC228|nr:D-cysteine desulfhydrase family protein [Corynebacterium pacaense]